MRIFPSSMSRAVFWGAGRTSSGLDRREKRRSGRYRHLLCQKCSISLRMLCSAAHICGMPAPLPLCVLLFLPALNPIAFEPCFALISLPGGGPVHDRSGWVHPGRTRRQGGACLHQGGDCKRRCGAVYMMTPPPRTARDFVQFRVVFPHLTVFRKPIPTRRQVPSAEKMPQSCASRRSGRSRRHRSSSMSLAAARSRHRRPGMRCSRSSGQSRGVAPCRPRDVVLSLARSVRRAVQMRHNA